MLRKSKQKLKKNSQQLLNRTCIRLCVRPDQHRKNGFVKSVNETN